MEHRLSFPGFVTAHSHAFQRALRGRGAGGDFWAWRDSMLAEADRQTPDTVRAGYTRTYAEMRACGYTAVGEFHYLGLDEAFAAVEAAQAAGVEIVLLLAAYERGGLERFRQSSVGEYLDQLERLREAGARVGAAPHSVRACSSRWLTEIGRQAAADRELVLHVHACEQPREIEDCIAEHGVRPIELLERCGCLGPRTTVVHATHASAAELDLVADAGAAVCLCPTTEANLGDGFPPLEALLGRRIRLAIGSDSNVRIDPLEELRELEGTARRQSGRREVVPLDQLLEIGSANGAAALGLDWWPDVEVDSAHPALAGVGAIGLRGALVFGCGADVFVR
jgi:formimidoylglutamate deiminase